MKSMNYLSCTLTLALAVSAVRAVSFPLEWNVNRRTDVPYEVELDLAKLERLAKVSKDSGFIVTALTPAGEQKVETVVLEGRTAGTAALRFSVPEGTTALRCDTVGTRVVAPVPGNLFAGALAPTAKWKLPNGATQKAVGSGLVFRSPQYGGTASYTVDVPEGAAGKPVKLELDCRSLSKMVWGGMIHIRQLDATGAVLPESLSDPRWTSHMRPPQKLTPYRERGRIHPQAKKLRLEIQLRYATEVKNDNYGLPLANSESLIPELEVSRLAVRVAEDLPFPKYRDDFFGAGVSGTPGDTALALGGERAFWYQTRSQASWAEARQIREESQTFFPAGAGTAEAWFKCSDWSATGRQSLLECYHHGANIEKGSRYKENRRVIFGVGYTAQTKTVLLQFKDANDKVFKQEVSCELPVDRWFHLAATWQPGGMAQVFVDGRSVLTCSLAGYAPYDLKTMKFPNDSAGTEFYLGSSSSSARIPPKASESASAPLFRGLADNLRISSGVRYTADFTPAKAFTVDAATRALFTFDRSFDGVSDGGIGWISGTIRDLVDRVDHDLTLEKDGRTSTVAYYSHEILKENHPDVVLNRLNYPTLPTAVEFAAARRTKRETRNLKSGETLVFDVAEKPYPDFVEIKNTGATPLLYPALVNKGEIDPRSFGDIADSLGTAGAISDRERANAVFNFVLGASDYFMNHQPIFNPGSDCPRSVEYEALVMLNAYCGFECGPLNNLAANMFACAGGVPAGQTGGYGHSFEQVFYDGKNHIYDLSAQKFFPAMDNETAAYLEESAQQPGVHYRLGGSADHFIRNGTRGAYVQTPAFQEKVAMTLNPGETFRGWFANDGACNDLQYNSCFCGNRRESPIGVKRETLSPYQENYEERCHAVCRRNLKGRPDDDLHRIDRFFPHYGNGFLLFDDKPTAGNPAFRDLKDGTFCYQVKTCYPIVAAEYGAVRKDGTPVALELSTDWTTFRPIGAKMEGPAADPRVRLDYEVRARQAYWIRVKAPIEEVERVLAKTEVMFNARIFPGKVRQGRNELLFKSVAGEGAQVTVQWRENAKPITFKGALASGTIPGYERQMVLLDPSREWTIDVEGVSTEAFATATAGVRARLEKGRILLSVAEDRRQTKGFIGFVTVQDGDVAKDLTVIACPNARLIPVGQSLAKTSDKVRLAYEKLPKGRYCLWTLARWESHPSFWKRRPLRAEFPQKKVSIEAAGPCNDGLMFYKAQYGHLGERANWVWDHALDPHSYYPYPLIRELELGGTSELTYRLQSDVPNGVEVAGALILPFPEQDFKCALKKILGGYNCVPNRVR